MERRAPPLPSGPSKPEKPLTFQGPKISALKSHSTAQHPAPAPEGSNSSVLLFGLSSARLAVALDTKTGLGAEVSGPGKSTAKPSHGPRRGRSGEEYVATASTALKAVSTASLPRTVHLPPTGRLHGVALSTYAPSSPQLAGKSHMAIPSSPVDSFTWLVIVVLNRGTMAPKHLPPP